MLRKFCLFMCALALVVCPQLAAAAANPEIKIESVTGAASQSVQVKVFLTNNGPAISQTFVFAVAYDSTKLSGNPTAIIGAAASSASKSILGTQLLGSGATTRIKLIIGNTLDPDTAVQDGILAIITFPVKADAGGSTIPLTFYAAPDVSDNTLDGNPVTVTATPGSITVIDTTPKVDTFTLPTYSKNLTISPISITGSDDVGVTGYKITESATAPLVGDAGWTLPAPATYTITGNTADGSKTLYAWAKDVDGHISASKSASVLLDRSTPVLAVSSPAGDVYTSATGISITGTVSDTGSGIDTLTVNGLSALPINPSDGSFTILLGSLPLNAATTVNVVATDKAGNQTTVSRIVHQDSNAPSMNITAPANNSRTNAVNGLVTVTGTISEPAKYLDIHITSSTTQDIRVPLLNGANTFSEQISLQPGANTIDIVALDLAENISSSKTITVYYDVTAPGVTITDPSDHITSINNNYTIKGSVSDNDTVQGATLTMTVGGNTVLGPVALTIGAGGVFEKNVAFPTDQTQYAITVTATDKAGNSATSTQRNIIYNSTASILSMAANRFVTNQTSYQASGAKADDATITVACTGSATAGAVSAPTTTSWNVTVSSLAEGDNSCTATSSGSAYNNGTLNFTIALDTVLPVVNAGGNQIKKALFTQVGTATDNNNLTYAWTKKSGPGAVTFGSGAAATTTISANVEGTYVLTLTATDAAGNSASSDMTLIWDTTPPTVNAGFNKIERTPFTQTAIATDTNTLTSFAWTKQAGPGTVTFGTANALTTTISANVDGIYTLRFTAIDAAGNSNFSDISMTWDTTAPVVSAGGDLRKGSAFVPTTASATDATTSVASYAWSGPPEVSFSNANILKPTISASADGVYLLTLMVTDAIANMGFSEMTLTWDTTAPLVTISAPSASITKNGDVTYTINYTNASSVSLDAGYVTVNKTGTANYGGIGVNGAGTASRTVTISGITGDGTLGISIAADTARNATNNPSLAVGPSSTFIVDNTKPAFASIDTLANGTVTSNNTLNVSAIVTEANTVSTVTVNNAPATLSNGSYSSAVTLANGANVITIVATDSVGNQETNTRTITYDHTAPVVTLSAATPADSSYVNLAAATISGTVSEPGTVEVKLNNVVVSTQNTTGAQNSFTAPITLAAGSNTIIVKASDAATPPNTTTGQRTVILDTTKPTLSIDDPAAAITTTLSSYLVKGSTTDQYGGIVLAFSVDGTPVNPAPAINAGLFQQNVPFTLGKSYTVSVSATDLAGNTSTTQQNIVYRPIAIADALRALQISVGLVQKTVQDDVLDVAPLVNNLPHADGSIDIGDALVLLRKTVGLVNW